MPEDCGSTRFSTSCVAIAASMALPPWRSISRPASAASGLAAATISCLATTTCRSATLRSWASAPLPAIRQKLTSVAANARRRTDVAMARNPIWSLRARLRDAWKGANEPSAVALRLGKGRCELVLDVPRKQDPGVLAHLGHVGVDHRSARGLGVDRGEMRLGQHVSHNARGMPGVDQVVDDQIALAVAGHALEDLDLAAHAELGVVIALHADRIDEPDIELARHDGGRHQAAAGDCDDAAPRSEVEEPPGERARMPVQIVPGYREMLERCLGLAVGLCHGRPPFAQRTKTWTSLPCAEALEVAERLMRSGGRPMLVSERTTVSALRLEVLVLSAAMPGLPPAGDTATTSKVAPGRRSSARLTAL